jgi:hypothetical protein
MADAAPYRKERREWEMGFGEVRWLLGLLCFFSLFFLNLLPLFLQHSFIEKTRDVSG